MLGVLDGIPKRAELREEVVPAFDLNDFADALVAARAWHAALEHGLLRVLVVGLQAGGFHRFAQDNNASLSDKS